MAQTDHLKKKRPSESAKKELELVAEWIGGNDIRWEHLGGALYECIDAMLDDKLSRYVEKLEEPETRQRVFRVPGSKYARILASGGVAHIHPIRVHGEAATVDSIPVQVGEYITIRKEVRVELATDFLVISKGKPKQESGHDSGDQE
ncbi:uncharacterized protein BDCG_07752 [Blastomyces dermatitidis ER-3]|uniref:Uncharacterized protein n=2 Tax=Blastomyces TaxID=229219 RepID=A0A179UJN8_BLAGS|nr:uncharacterized protein BDBG_03437 [Blastomyces gilchristii SLH14081]XP_045278918.1 uncharacterized protein BDCG_07752 [Blastomyces dermatitidis ER-3]EEQ92632.2 hypothetical protein BDCG_07752 [Blastomyces dermatitidis ER-3]OAT07367.1 hypothetical protein BDBG_03437 [Blastomyces gilchristii SLH14081]